MHSNCEADCCEAVRIQDKKTGDFLPRSVKYKVLEIYAWAEQFATLA